MPRTDLEQLIWDDAAVTIQRDECASQAGDQLVVEKLTTIDCQSVVTVDLYFAHADRDVPQFPPLVVIHREQDGEAVTLRCELDSVQNNYLGGGGSFRAVYSVAAELG